MDEVGKQRIEALEHTVATMYSAQVQATARLVVLEGALGTLVATLAKTGQNPDEIFETYVAAVEAQFEEFRATPEGKSPDVFKSVGHAVEVLLHKMRTARSRP